MKVLVILLFLTSFGCATFQDKYSVDENITLSDQNLHLLNGSYELTSSKTLEKSEYSKLKVSERDTLNRNNLFGFMNNRDHPSKTGITKNTNDYSVYLDVENENTLAVRLVKNNTAIDSMRLKYKLKNDGYVYVYFAEPNFKINKIPFLFGGFEIGRNRLGINKNRDLIRESSHFKYGAALVIIGDTRKYKTSSRYKRKL